MATSPRCIELSVRIYRVLVRAYPASFRTEYGTEMTEVFRDLATDAIRQRDAVGLIIVWYRVLRDLLGSSLQEHSLEWQRRFQMKTAAFAVVSLLLAAIVYGVMLGAVGISLIALFWITESPMFTSGRGNAIMELVLVYLPAFMTGMILVRVKPYYLPMVTATLGTMAYCACIASLDTGAPWWARVGFVASVGVVTTLGCLVPTGLRRRLKRPCAV